MEGEKSRLRGAGTSFFCVSAYVSLLRESNSCQKSSLHAACMRGRSTGAAPALHQSALLPSDRHENVI